MRKTFVMDTSVFVYDPNSFMSFAGNDVLIPFTVLEELDKVKKFASQDGRNARVAIRALDKISDLGEIHHGIHIDHDITLKIDTSSCGAIGSDPSYGDSKILACASKAKSDNPNTTVILVSKDINLRIKAKSFGLIAQDYEKDKIPSNDLFEGFQSVKNQDAGLALFDAGVIMATDYPELSDLYPNEFVLLVGDDGKGIAAGRRIKDQIKLVRDRNPWGLELRNKEQLFATDLLLDPNIPLVTLIGKAGTGKTLVSLACGLELTLEKRLTSKMVIYRPIQPMGNDIGFLPGSLEEKLEPWMSAVTDGFEFLLDSNKSREGWRHKMHQFVDEGRIQMEALTYIRGRSIPNSFILVDEAQNLSKEEVKTILTRAGINTKIVLTGDICQIDNSYLDATNNGLTYVVEKFKKSSLAGHITFSKGERSPLATEASDIL
jgi:PhoH-like ATPase